MSSIHARKQIKVSEQDVEMRPASPLKKKYEELSFKRKDENLKEEEPLSCLNGNVGF